MKIAVKIAWAVALATVLALGGGSTEAKKSKAEKQMAKAAKKNSNVKSVKQRDITRDDLLGMIDDYNDEVAAERARMVDTALQRMALEYDAHRATGAPYVRDILIISGGGAKGAFGSGFFQGWKTVAGDMALPEFDVVTGVSTGALISPFAFIGTDDAYSDIATFYANPDPKWAHKRGAFALTPGHVSLANDDLLQEQVRTTVDAAMVQAMADAAAEHRLLEIGATNLDLGVGRIFDMGHDAIEAARTGSLDRIHSTLLSSSAIPGTFPPVMIDGLFYGDGGATSNLTLFVDESMPRRWEEMRPGAPLPKFRVWIVVNQPLRIKPVVTKAKYLSVAGRGLGTATHSLQLFAMHLLSEVAQDMRDSGLDVEFRWVAIPEDAPKNKTKSMFDETWMRALQELGRKMGADTSSWKTEVPSIYALTD